MLGTTMDFNERVSGPAVLISNLIQSHHLCGNAVWILISVILAINNLNNPPNTNNQVINRQLTISCFMQLPYSITWHQTTRYSVVNILLNILQDTYRALYARISDSVNDQQSPDQYSFQYSYFLSSNVTLIMNRRRLWKCLTAIMLINTLPNILTRHTLCITLVLKMVYTYFDNKSYAVILMFYNITRREKYDINVTHLVTS